MASICVAILSGCESRDYLGQPCPYCGVAMSGFNGRNDWRASSRDHRIPKSLSAFEALGKGQRPVLARAGRE
jgi:hypothetical protein